MPSDYIETRPATAASGVTCRECREEVEWITFLADGGNIGVCACSWTTWMKTDNRKVIRSTTKEPESAQEIQYQHSTKYCPCESCETHRKWYCPTCDVLMSSPESTRCVNGHERRVAQKG